jgi:hypothetical protein
VNFLNINLMVSIPAASNLSTVDRRTPRSDHGFDADPGCVESKMLTPVLRLMGFALLAMALAAVTASTSQAVGSFQTKPAFPDEVRTGEPPVPPALSWPGISASNFVGGCGRGRISDPHTHGCDGPADIR